MEGCKMGVDIRTGEYRGWDTTSREGREGEDLIISYLKYNGFKIIDVRDIKEFQDIDTDIILVNEKGQNCKIEIKTDKRMYETKNICVDAILHKRNKCVDGYFYKCQADYLFYLDRVNNIIFVIKWKLLHDWIVKTKKEMYSWWNSIDGCNVDGFLIPVKELFKNNFIESVYFLYFGDMKKGILNFNIINKLKSYL